MPWCSKHDTGGFQNYQAEDTDPHKGNNSELNVSDPHDFKQYFLAFQRRFFDILAVVLFIECSKTNVHSAATQLSFLQ